MAEKLEVLRKGDGWKLPSQKKIHKSGLAGRTDNENTRRASDRFLLIARAHGSSAKWFPETGYLVTEDPTEVAKEFPYEEWRDQALKEAGHI